MEARSMKRARTSAPATTIASGMATLTTLPPELIYNIVDFLDNESWFALAIAWRPFLHAYAQSLDPWNAVRKRLVAAVGHKNFRYIQWEKLVEMNEAKMHAAGIYARDWPEPSPSLLRSFVDYEALDKHRRSASYIPIIKIWVADDAYEWTRIIGSPEFVAVLDNVSFELQCDWDGFPLSMWHHFVPALCCRVVPITRLRMFIDPNFIPVPPRSIEAFLNGLRSNETLQSLRLDYCHDQSTNDAINASIIDAVAGHVRLRELDDDPIGPLSVNALVRLLRFGTVKLDKLILASNFSALSDNQMTAFGEALAANATIKTVELAPMGHDYFRNSPQKLDAFLNGYLNADRSHSIVQSIHVYSGREDVDWLKQSMQWFDAQMNGRVVVSFGCATD